MGSRRFLLVRIGSRFAKRKNKSQANAKRNAHSRSQTRTGKLTSNLTQCSHPRGSPSQPTTGAQAQPASKPPVSERNSAGQQGDGQVSRPMTNRKNIRKKICRWVRRRDHTISHPYQRCDCTKDHLGGERAHPKVKVGTGIAVCQFIRLLVIRIKRIKGSRSETELMHAERNSEKNRQGIDSCPKSARSWVHPSSRIQNRLIFDQYAHELLRFNDIFSLCLAPGVSPEAEIYLPNFQWRLEKMRDRRYQTKQNNQADWSQCGKCLVASLGTLLPTEERRVVLVVATRFSQYLHVVLFRRARQRSILRSRCRRDRRWASSFASTTSTCRMSAKNDTREGEQRGEWRHYRHTGSSPQCQRTSANSTLAGGANTRATKKDIWTVRKMMGKVSDDYNRREFKVGHREKPPALARDNAQIN
ncbi:hypothetical protein H4582DRAFT_2131712 [Lactarius indigo]|nr:hypothetical protein H4582DRAFT_2131712 [Lactarius indigo]